MDYETFIASKRRSHVPAGFEARDLHPSLFEHQTAIVRWSCRLGRSAVFADTGLGKMRIELEWGWQVHQQTGGQVLLFAPLAVGEQILDEARKMGRPAGAYGSGQPIEVINYDRLHQVDPARFVGCILDESSILKSQDGRTRTALIDVFQATPYKLAGTATPAPNDHTELGNHAEFLGICSRAEMLAEFFVHDGGSTQDWRLKGHARAEFWRWVASWAVVVRKPSDLGFDDGRYDLPPLTLETVTVALGQQEARNMGLLFTPQARGLLEQRKVRKASIDARAEAIAEMVNASTEPFVVWCELNDESSTIAALIPDAVEVRGSDKVESKVERLQGFASGKYRVLVTKPSICGFGLNWQHCRRMVFAGVSNSYEQFYQAIRRCWRFGQEREVIATLIGTDADGAITANLKRKSDAHEEMAAEMLSLVQEHQLESVIGRRPGRVEAANRTPTIPRWLKQYALEVA